MRTQTAIKVGGAMLAFLYNSYSIAAQFYPTTKPTDRGFWIRFSIGFLVFAGFVFWGWFSASWKLREHENIHPIAKVTPRYERYFAYLEVENTGQNRASFGVQVLQWQGIERLAPEMRGSYRAKWQNNLNNPYAAVYELIPSQSNRLLLIQAAGEFLNEKDTTDKSQHNVEMPSEFETRTGLVRLNNEVKVAIKVFSDPRLKIPVQRTYILSLDIVDGKEVWTQFRELK